MIIFVQVSKERKGVVVDARCRDLTSSATMEKARKNPGSVPTCSFHDARIPSSGKGYDNLTSLLIEPGRSRTRESHTAWHPYTCGCSAIRTREGYLPVFYRSKNGRITSFSTLFRHLTILSDGFR